MAYSSSRGTAGVVSGPLFYPRCYPEELLRGPGQKQIMGCSSEPSNPIFYSGQPTGRLCQVFNCFGNGTLILQLMALALLERARKSWQRIPETETAMASLLSICCLRCTKYTHTHISTLLRTNAQAPQTGIKKNPPKIETLEIYASGCFCQVGNKVVVQLSWAQRSASQQCSARGSFFPWFLCILSLPLPTPPSPPPLSLCPLPPPSVSPPRITSWASSLSLHPHSEPSVSFSIWMTLRLLFLFLTSMKNFRSV